MTTAVINSLQPLPVFPSSTGAKIDRVYHQNTGGSKVVDLDGDLYRTAIVSVLIETTDTNPFSIWASFSMQAQNQGTYDFGVSERVEITPVTGLTSYFAKIKFDLTPGNRPYTIWVEGNTTDRTDIVINMTDQVVW